MKQSVVKSNIYKTRKPWDEPDMYLFYPSDMECIIENKKHVNFV